MVVSPVRRNPNRSYQAIGVFLLRQNSHLKDRRSLSQNSLAFGFSTAVAA